MTERKLAVGTGFLDSLFEAAADYRTAWAIPTIEIIESSYMKNVSLSPD